MMMIGVPNTNKIPANGINTSGPSIFFSLTRWGFGRFQRLSQFGLSSTYFLAAQHGSSPLEALYPPI
jgi:hypothetical protein